jgi:hypothetical protein
LHFSHLHGAGWIWLVGKCDWWTRPRKAWGTGQADAWLLHKSCKTLVASNGPRPQVVPVSRWGEQLCRSLSRGQFAGVLRSYLSLHAAQLVSSTSLIFSAWFHDVSTGALVCRRAVRKRGGAKLICLCLSPWKLIHLDSEKLMILKEMILYLTRNTWKEKDINVNR